MLPSAGEGGAVDGHVFEIHSLNLRVPAAVNLEQAEGLVHARGEEERGCGVEGDAADDRAAALGDVGIRHARGGELSRGKGDSEGCGAGALADERARLLEDALVPPGGVPLVPLAVVALVPLALLVPVAVGCCCALVWLELRPPGAWVERPMMLCAMTSESPGKRISSALTERRGRVKGCRAERDRGMSENEGETSRRQRASEALNVDIPGKLLLLLRLPQLPKAVHRRNRHDKLRVSLVL